MTDKSLGYQEIFALAMAALAEKPSFFTSFRDRVAIGQGEEGWPGYRLMTPEEVKARDEENIQREARNKALVDQAFLKLSQDEIDALEWHYSSEFY